jgi:IstB-like ATP binding protein
MSDLQHQRIVELCQELRLSAMPNRYSGIAQSAAAKDASFADFLEQTLRAARDARSARAREMFARVAGFPAIKTLDGFDFGFATGAQPSADRQVRGLAVDDQAFLCQPAGQRHVEAVPQIADEPLDLALGLRPIRGAQPRPETAVPGKVEKAGMKTVTTATVAVPLQHDGAHIVGKCRSAWNKDPNLECAPRGGQFQVAGLTICRAC